MKISLLNMVLNYKVENEQNLKIMMEINLCLLLSCLLMI